MEFGEAPVPPRGFAEGAEWPEGGEGGGEGSAAWDPGAVAAPRVPCLGRRVLGTAGLFELPGVPGGRTIWGVYIDIATLVRGFLESSSPSQLKKKAGTVGWLDSCVSTQDQKRSTLPTPSSAGAPPEDSTLDWKSGSQGSCSPKPRKSVSKTDQEPVH